MATKEKVQQINDGITAVAPIVEKEDTTPRVKVFIPLPLESGDGLKQDPYEHVTINGENPYYIKRGEYVDVPVPVFMQLRNRYPNL